MSFLANRLSILKNTRYLEGQLKESNILEVELLENGKRLRQQIEKQCSKTQILNDGKMHPVNFATGSSGEVDNFKDINARLRFIYKNEFRNNMRFLRETTHFNESEGVIKTMCNDPLNYIAEDMPLRLKYNNDENSNLLNTDYFFHTASGLAKLYNIQRERKIWWMRFSADPSRYYLKPFELVNKESNTGRSIDNAQSITIKAHLPIGEMDVEHITLVPLNSASLQNEKDFEICDERTKKNQLPSVIRSVINLNMATCALIFDGAANKKRENTLFLNRKLTPYQCLVTCLDKDANSNDLKRDLCTHISNILHHAGLRLFNMNQYTENSTDANTQLDLADKLGIPYTILVSSNSLLSGLLELRNRDTTLSETIHITDIPGYLLSIFHSN